VLPAQESPKTTDALSPSLDPREGVALDKTVNALKALKASITEAEAGIAAKRVSLGSTTTPAEREAIEAAIKALNDKLTLLLADYESVAANIDLKAYQTNPNTDFNLTGELQDFLHPIVVQMKEITSRPREIDELSSKIDYYTARKKIAGTALEHLAKLLAATDDPVLTADLKEIRKTWKQRLEQAENDLTISEFQLNSKKSEEGPILKTISAAAASFFRTRGRNLLIAFIGFIFVFSFLRLIQRYIHRLSPMRKRGQRSIMVRIVDIGYYFFTIITSTGVVLFVFYASNDWLLLGLALMFLAGIAWTGKRTFPIVYEQIKLMLNLGSVREGERVLYNGIPWNINSINLFTDLSNPALQGGLLRLPLRDLVPLLSRPYDPKELWFPSEVGDWVMLSDKNFGRVVSQSPEWVQIVKLGGNRKTYTTSDYISLNPENLSHNFRVSVIFGIDYQHQAESTIKIPEILQQQLRSEVQKMVGEENLLNLAVEFREASSSSLDYEIIADFTGSAASKFNKIQRAIPRICVDECNRHGWVIPFTQITLHQAPSTDASALGLES
jgi:hypothetical protein